MSLVSRELRILVLYIIMMIDFNDSVDYRSSIGLRAVVINYLVV